MRTALLLLAAVACANPAGPPIATATPVAATPEMVEWWHEVEVCSQLRGDFSRVHLYRAPDAAFERKALGAWYPEHDIVVVDAAVGLKTTWQHEFLHDLIGVPDLDHVNPAWERCRL